MAIASRGVGHVSIAYAATTDGCTFLLDEDGVCRRALLHCTRAARPTRPSGKDTRAGAARRCIGAQYVASIDVRVDGGLVPMPRVGVPMLFAYTGDDGRIAVVRTGPLVRFEDRGSGGHPARGDPHRLKSDDTDDECLTIPLHQSGERVTPRVSLFDPDETAQEAAHDPWVPPPETHLVQPRRDDAHAPAEGQRGGTEGVGAHAEAHGDPAHGKGMLPKKAGRG